MTRLTWPIAVCLVVGFAVGTAQGKTAEEKCRGTAATRAAAMYSSASGDFYKCAKATGRGKFCSEALRDAKVQARLFKTRVSIERKCDPTVVGPWGYASASKFGIQVGGRAAAEGRYVADSIFGRIPALMTEDSFRCASLIAKLVRKAGKKEIKERIKCGRLCSAKTLAKIEALWSRADEGIRRGCSAAALDSLLGTTDPTDHLTEMRAGAIRVYSAVGNTVPMSAFASVIFPAQSSVLEPESFPIEIPVRATVGGVPHSSYATVIKVGGTADTRRATYDPLQDEFVYTEEVYTPGDGTSYQIPVRVYSYLGEFDTVRTVKFNLATLSPGVVIDSPVSGTITSEDSIAVSGRVIGNFSSPPATLWVNGTTVGFEESGNWSTVTALDSNLVQIIEADVSSGVGYPGKDTTVVLKGTPLEIGPGIYVDSGLYDRLNNSGFSAVESMILTELQGALSPAAIGEPDPSCGTGYRIEVPDVASGCIDEFTFGAPNVPYIGAVGPDEINLDLNLPLFHLRLEDVDAMGLTCNLTCNWENVNIFVDADLTPDLPEPPMAPFLAVMNAPVTVGFTPEANACSISAGSDPLTGWLCELGGLFYDPTAEITLAFQGSIETELPATLNATLAGIDVSTPIAEETGVLFEGLFKNVPEDEDGITFVVNENAIALEPIPDAPPIDFTLLPDPKPAPDLGPVIPDGQQLWWVPDGASYDLAFCLTDGLLNRFMAAFMLQGMFNQSVSDFPGIGPLTTDLITLLFGDPAFSMACPGCALTIAVAPTAAPVARPPLPGEDADIVLVIPNYRMDLVADDDGTPVPLMAATIVFELPLKLGAAGEVIAPQIGTPEITNLKVVENPIGVQSTSIANIEAQLATLFPEMAASFGDLFTSISLPPFQGMTMAAWGSGYNNSCAALYLGFDAPPPSPTPTPTSTATITRTPTITPTITPTVPGPPPLGSHLFTLAVGSKAKVKGVITLSLDLSGELMLVGSAVDQDGVASIQVPKERVSFDPVYLNLPGIDAVCVLVEDDGSGFIDCDGGDTGINVSQTQDHNVGAPPCPEGATEDLVHPGVCNGPANTTFDGTFTAGDMSLSMFVTIKMLARSEYGPDGQACTADDLAPAMEPISMPVTMTTGTSYARIDDANNFAGLINEDQADGVPFNCVRIRNGDLTGAKVVGAFTSLDAPSIGDIVTTLTLVAE